MENYKLGQKILVILWVFSFACPMIYANETAQLMTPSERIRENVSKAQDNPLLRGRWNRKSHEPASEQATVNDNLPQRILSNFRSDPELAELAVRLKVRSEKGMVILEGVVNNADERDLIGRRVSRMEGVKKIDNRLTIKTSNQDLVG